MKKLLAVVLCMIIVLSLGACGTSASTVEELEKMQAKLSDAFYACDDFVGIVASNWDKISPPWFDTAEPQDYMKDYYLPMYKAVSARVNLKNSLKNINSEFKLITPSKDNQEYYDSLKELYLCVDSYYKFVAEYPADYSYNDYLDKTKEFKSKFNEIESEISLIK